MVHLALWIVCQQLRENLGKATPSPQEHTRLAFCCGFCGGGDCVSAACKVLIRYRGYRRRLRHCLTASVLKEACDPTADKARHIQS